MHDLVFGEIYIEGLSTKLYIGGLSTKLIIGVCPLQYIGGLSTNEIYLCFENSFPYMVNAYVRESVRTQGMGHGM